MKPAATGRAGAPVTAKPETEDGAPQTMTSIEIARGEVEMDSPPAWRATAAAFTAAGQAGQLDLPLPGGGRTRERWARLGRPGRRGPVPGPAGRGARRRGRDPGRAGRPAARARQPLGSMGRPAPGQRRDRDPYRPGLAAHRPQAVLLRRAGLHLRAGHRGRAGRDPALRGGHRGAHAVAGRLAGHRDGRAATRSAWTSTTSRRAGGAARRVYRAARVRARWRGRGGVLVRRGARGRGHAARRGAPPGRGPARPGSPGRRQHRA